MHRLGILEDITVQFPSLHDLAHNEAHPYFGANPGRVVQTLTF